MIRKTDPARIVFHGQVTLKEPQGERTRYVGEMTIPPMQIGDSETGFLTVQDFIYEVDGATGGLVPWGEHRGDWQRGYVYAVRQTVKYEGNVYGYDPYSGTIETVDRFLTPPSMSHDWRNLTNVSIVSEFRSWGPFMGEWVEGRLYPFLSYVTYGKQTWGATSDRGDNQAIESPCESGDWVCLGVTLADDISHLDTTKAGSPTMAGIGGHSSEIPDGGPITASMIPPPIRRKDFLNGCAYERLLIMDELRSRAAKKGSKKKIRRIMRLCFAISRLPIATMEEVEIRDLLNRLDALMLRRKRL